MRANRRIVSLGAFVAAAMAGQLAMASTAFGSGSITGTVTDANGPLQGACVEAYLTTGVPDGQTTSGPDGTYAITGLAPGSYVVHFGDCTYPPVHVAEYYNDQATFNAADRVTVVDGPAATADATLARYGSVSGTVTGPSGPLADACVQLYKNQDSVGTSVRNTAADGSFLWELLTPGTYRIQFVGDNGGLCPFLTPIGPRAVFASEFWPDEYLLRNADPIVVGDGQSVTGVNGTVAATRPPRTAISGTVRNEYGPAAGVCVKAFDYTSAGPPGIGPVAVTGADGSYALDLEDGDYALLFQTVGCAQASGRPIADEYYGDASGPTNLITVPDTGGVSGKDELVNALPDTTITAAPAGQTGAGVAGFRFESDDPAAHFDCTVDGRPGGSCASPLTLQGLAAGDHTLSVQAVDAEGGRDPSPATVAWTVVPGADVSVHGTAPPGGTVSTDPTGAGPDASHPVTTAVTVPGGGEVTINEASGSSTHPPKGLTLLDYEIEISAPSASVDDPLRLVFTLDAKALQGLDPKSIAVIRDGQPMGVCTGQGARPDPCEASRRTLPGGDLELTVLSSHASTWNFGAAACVVPKLVGKRIGKAKKLLKKSRCKLGKVKAKNSPKKPGTVISQRPKPRAVKPAGAKVAVTVSKR